jgi:hypothetical protein
MSAKWANAVRSQMVPGKNPLPRYHAYRKQGRLTYKEQQELTTELFDQLQDRLIRLERQS